MDQISWMEGHNKWYHKEITKVPNYFPHEILASEDPLGHCSFSMWVFIHFCFRSSMPINSAVRCPTNQRVSSTPQEDIFVQPSLSNTSLMSTPMTSLGPWLTLVGSLVTCMLHFSSTTCTSYMMSRYIVYGWPSCQWSYYHSVWIHPPISHPAGWEAQTHSILLCAHYHPLQHIGAHHVENHNLSSLRILGSVSEPLNPDVWNWYNEHVGKRQCAVAATFWYLLHILWGLLMLNTYRQKLG